jgi:hypothetical protein
MVIDIVETRTETIVDETWEVILVNGDVWHTSRKATAEEAVADARQSMIDIEQYWDDLERKGGMPKRKVYDLAGVRKRIITTVSTMEITAVQPISGGA